jgi:hypothetical protein
MIDVTRMLVLIWLKFYPRPFFIDLLSRFYIPLGTCTYWKVKATYSSYLLKQFRTIQLILIQNTSIQWCQFIKARLSMAERNTRDHYDSSEQDRWFAIFNSRLYKWTLDYSPIAILVSRFFILITDSRFSMHIFTLLSLTTIDCSL